MNQAKTAELMVIKKQLNEIKPHPKNPRQHDDRQIEKLRHSIRTHGFAKGSIVIQKSTGYILAGHGIIEALKKEDYNGADVVEVDLPDDKALAFLIADNHIAEQSTWDDISLQNAINELSEMDIPALDFGFDDVDLSELADRILEGVGGLDGTADGQADIEHQSLADRFIVPPFSVLDARQGYWQERKRAWIALGIKSELGRGATALICPQQWSESQTNLNGLFGMKIDEIGGGAK